MNEKVSFLVVGTQKAGTTALDRYLRDHPNIEMASEKEVHFFDEEENFKGSVNYEKYHQFFSGNSNKIKGECTPIYIYWSSSIRRIYEYNPKMKVIAILRNPIERSFSHWNMERDRNAETIEFSIAIRTERDRCKSALPNQHRIYSYTDRGLYSEQILRIWRYFPQDQTLFIKHEDLKTNPHQTLNEICTFLGISELKNVKEKKIHIRPYINKMADIDRAFLENFFCDDIKKVEIMLNWDCSSWS